MDLMQLETSILNRSVVVNRIVNVVVISAVLPCAMGSLAFGAGLDVAKTPLGKDVTRGSDAADDCVLKPPAAHDACLSVVQEKGHKQGGDTTAFDTGLYFSAWFALDLIVNSSLEVGVMAPAKSPDEVMWKPFAVKYFKAYVEARKKTGLTDDQVLLITMLNHDLVKPRMAFAERGY